MAGGSDGFHIFTNRDLDLGVFVAGETWPALCGFNMASLSDGWHHIAAVGSGDSTDFYIDGAYVGTSDANAAGDVRTVGNKRYYSWQFSDALDDIRIYDGAMSATAIADMQ